MKIKKILALVVALAQMVIVAPQVEAYNRPMEKRMLMVSAYYSPLPNQSFYMRGSYAADIRLNGRGTNGADGTEVYIGMLAAPKTYPFGTRIRIPGLGVGEVHDRGGAILARKNYDRIDVWMGHGEEGLSRALNWGMRLVEGDVYFTPHQVQPGLNFSWVSPQLPASTLNRLKGKTLNNPQTFTKPITKASPKTDVRELQETLNTFGYYHGEVTGLMDQATKDAVLAFQVSEGVIQNKQAVGAGYLGPKTRQALKSKLENFNNTVLQEQKRLEKNVTSLAAGLGKSAEGEEVYRLQQMLWELGYYKGELNGYYDKGTIDAVFRFQKSHDVIANDWDRGAGFYGKKTHQALVAAVDTRIDKVAMVAEQKQSWVPAKIDLPRLTQLNAGDVVKRPALSFDLNIAVEPSLDRFNRTLDFGTRGYEVSNLQSFLVEKGYLTKGLDTGYFGFSTQKALTKFQLDNGIVKTASDAGAGRLGPQTRKALNKLAK